MLKLRIRIGLPPNPRLQLTGARLRREWNVQFGTTRPAASAEARLLDGAFPHLARLRWAGSPFAPWRERSWSFMALVSLGGGEA